MGKAAAAKATTTQSTQAQRVDSRKLASRGEHNGVRLDLPSTINRLHRAVGNRATSSLLRPRAIQPKLTVSKPDDEYEREADRVAETVMRMPEPGSVALNQNSPLDVQRKCKECEEEVQRQANDLALSPGNVIGTMLGDETVVQRSPSAEGSEQHTDANVEQGIQALRGHGHPLPAGEREFMESRFGYNFAGVRIHRDGRAAELARKLSARAFTLGPNVVFGSGEYRPATTAGRSLLAHELTHVIQQAPSALRMVQRQPQAQKDPAAPMSQAEEDRLSQRTPGQAVIQSAPPALSLFNFANDSDEPKAFHRALLIELASFLRESFPAPLRIKSHGHASSPGTTEHNLGLSRRRAQKVAAILRGAGATRVDVFASGENAPVATNETVEGRTRNRRVDLQLAAMKLPDPKPGPEPPKPQPDKTPCERFPILCSLSPIPIPFLPFLVCLIAPELCALLPCLLNPTSCLPPTPPKPPKPPDKPDKPDPPPSVFFGHVRASNTPSAMGDRIPDKGSTSVGVVVAGLRPSHGPLVIGRVGASILNGDFLINGATSTTITGSTVLSITGVTQTEAMAGGFNLHLEATVGGNRIALSAPFAVSDIMENMKTRKDREIVDPTGATLDVVMSWDSDGRLGIASLNLMEYGENLRILVEEGGMKGLGLGRHSFLALADREQIDQHGTTDPFMRAEGRQELLQVHTLVDYRTNSVGENIPVTNSGFGITRVVEPDPQRPGCLRFVVTKFGLGGTANGFTSGAGSGTAQMIVPLPCGGGGGGGGGGTTPSTPTIPTPHVGPLPTGNIPFGLVSGVPCDPPPGTIVAMRIVFESESTDPRRPGKKVFTTTIMCRVDDTTPSNLFLVTLNPVPLSVAPSGFEARVIPARHRIVIPKSKVC